MNEIKAVDWSNSQLNNTAVIRISARKLYSIFIGILPLCMYYRFPFLEYGVGTVLTAVFLPYLLLCLVKQRRKTYRSALVGIYLLYLALRSSGDTTTMLLMGIALLHVFCAPISIDETVCKKTIVFVSIAASVVLILQRLLSVLGMNVSFFITSIMLAEFREVSSVLAGQELTRMSGLFAEPAHFAEYALIGLILVMMQPKQDVGGIQIKKALIITLAILVSTSGIGILGAIAVWGYYVLFHSKFLCRYPLFLRILFLLVAGLAAFLVLYQIPVFRLSFTRIFGTVDNYNAILGRSLFTEMYLEQLQGSEWLWGLGVVEVNHFLLAVVDIIYRYGLIGLGLLILGLFSYIFRGRREVRAMCLIYIGFLLASGMTGFLNYIFYLCVIANSFAGEKKLRAQVHSTYEV